MNRLRALWDRIAPPVDPGDTPARVRELDALAVRAGQEARRLHDRATRLEYALDGLAPRVAQLEQDVAWYVEADRIAGRIPHLRADDEREGNEP